MIGYVKNAATTKSQKTGPARCVGHGRGDRWVGEGQEGGCQKKEGNGFYAATQAEGAVESTGQREPGEIMKRTELLYVRTKGRLGK